MSINLKKYWAVILILHTIVGFVSKALYNYPLTIMAVIGLMSFLLLFYFLIKSRRKIKNISYEFVFLIPVLVSLFPFNSHMAFYGSVWSSMIWLLMAVYFSSLRLALSRHTI